MKSSLWPHILSIFALGVFCILAAGSMDDSSSSKSSSAPSPEQQAASAASNPSSIGVALRCVDVRDADTSHVVYFYYGDILKEWFKLLPSGVSGPRASLSLAKTTDEDYSFNGFGIRGYGDGPNDPIDSTPDTLTLARNYSTLDDKTTYQGVDIYGHYSCQPMDMADASRILQERSWSIKRSDAENRNK